jgi:extracellular elastinolytic metalloproteinase
LVVDPQDLTRSPLGWHDDGTTNFTILRGNNVHAFDDLDANNLPPAVEPDCGAGLACDFNFPIPFGTADPVDYTSASVSNLFYWANIVHDIQYGYGFDEAAGNFQVDNFANGGIGSDEVQALGQKQGAPCPNNAFFGTPPDGNEPDMIMCLWTSSSPRRDFSWDSGVMTHEYGHGISNRLVGGPSNVSCLGNSQQGGEGYSDWWSLAYTGEVGDQGTDVRGSGTYILGQPTTGGGIRPQPYSTDPAVNNHTYESINGIGIPHGVGAVWAQATWEVYWALVDHHGFDPDLYNALGGSGNQRMMLYVNEGLKNSACSPTFTDVRDGIIQAAVDNFGGEDVCRMWQAFADFGLGTDAVSGGSNSTNPTNGFAIPESCLTDIFTDGFESGDTTRWSSTVP